MPLFAYVCDPCGARFELNRPVDDRDEPAACKTCGGDGRRLFEACAIRQPCKAWHDLTARDLLGPDDAAARGRVTVTVGAAKVRPRL